MPYSYNWNTGDSTASIQNVCGGTYIVTSTDANICNTFTDTIVIDSTTAIGFSVSTSSTNINCLGVTDGSATAIISGGSTGGGNISYCTSGPSLTSYSNIENVRLIGDNDSISNNTIGICDTYQNYLSKSTGLSVGQSYNMQVNLGTCHATFALIDVAKVFVDWNIDGDFNDAGEMIQLIGPTQSPSINTFSFTVPSSATAGNTRMRIVSQSYGYNGSSILFTACDSTVLVGATEDYTLSINAGTPATFLWNTGDTTAQISNLSAGTYVVTVSDTNSCSLQDSVTITQPTAITASATTTDVSCNGGNDGTASLTLSGGTGTLSADWGTLNPNALPVGTHTYTITDANNCVLIDSVTITQPTAITASATTTDVSCNGGNDGTASLTLSGGTGTLSADWGTLNPNALPVGTHTYTITDANNCVLIDSVTITQPTAITASATTTDVSCNGGNDGTASLTLSGGTGTLSADWGTLNPNALPVGTHTYTITDANNCVLIDSVTITQPTAITASATTTDVSCNGGNDGTASLTLSGGTGTLSADWGTLNPNALPVGTHTYTITDANNCVLIDSVTITQPTAITASATTTDVSCNGGNDGTASLTLSGGTGTLSADWGTLNPNALPVGTHTYTITDANNCVLIDSVLPLLSQLQLLLLLLQLMLLVMAKILVLQQLYLMEV